MTAVITKSAAVWLIMVAAAIANGLARDTLLTPLLGGRVSLPLSGITLSALILAIACLAAPRLGASNERTWLFIGLFWAGLTLVFEYGFGHYVAGRPWREIHQVFNIADGNLFILVIAATLASPWVAAKLRGLI